VIFYRVKDVIERVAPETRKVLIWQQTSHLDVTSRSIAHKTLALGFYRSRDAGNREVAHFPAHLAKSSEPQQVMRGSETE